MRYVDPTGQWIDNHDGTFTAEKGDTLWGLYGADWQEKSGYGGNPADLRIDAVVGNRIETIFVISENIPSFFDSFEIEDNLQQNSWKSWWNKLDGSQLTDEEAKIQKILGTSEVIVGPIGGTVLTAFDPAGFLAGMYIMADGAIVISEAQNKIKRTPIIHIPRTFVMPFIKTNGIILPVGGTFIW